MIAAGLNVGEYAIAVATLLAAVASFITVIVNLKQGKGNAAKIDTVHELVNNAADEQSARVEQLGNALQDAGVKVPPKP